jgi:hypothetical protein
MTMFSCASVAEAERGCMALQAITPLNKAHSGLPPGIACSNTKVKMFSRMFEIVCINRK